MNVLNLPHLNVVPDDIRKRIDRVWISGQKGAIITKSNEVYTINISGSSDPVIYIAELCRKKAVVVDISFGENFVIALTVNGQIYSWGENEYGQLGLGHKTATHTPTMIPSLSDKSIIKIACGEYSAIALCENGEIFYWGRRSTSATLCFPTKWSTNGVSIACCFQSVILSNSYTDNGGRHSNDIYVFTCFNVAKENKLRFPGGYIEFKNMIEKVVCGHSHILVLDYGGKVQIARNDEKGFIQLDISEKIIDIAASPISSLSAVMADNKTIFVWKVEDKNAEIKPYPTSFVSFQEAFLTLSEPKTSYGVFHLKNNNTGKKLNIEALESIIEIFDEPECSDFTVLIEEKKIHVHKAILHARSSYFRAMFQEQWKETKENQLKITEYSYEGYKTYLKYLYGMDIDTNITSEIVLDLMGIASEYMDESLERLITMKVENDVTTAKPIKLLKEMMGLSASDREVFCKGLSKFICRENSSPIS